MKTIFKAYRSIVNSNILNKKLLKIVLIIIIPLIIRIIIVFQYNTHYIGNDGIGYNNLAVNLLNGNGYSSSIQPPFESNYTREPGYPLVITFVYKISTWMGFSPSIITQTQLPEPTVPIYFLKIFQSVLNSFSILLIYMTLSLTLKNKFSFTISLLFGLFLPFAVNPTYLLRESVQVFFLISSNYYLLKFFVSKNIINFLFFSIFISLSTLVFQITLYLPLFLFVVLIFYYKDFKKALGNIALMYLIILFFSFPWLLRTYQFYPDFRILKSYGTNITNEVADWISVVYTLQYAGLLKANEPDILFFRPNLYNLSQKQIFDYSFNGFYDHQKDSLKTLLDNKSYITAKLKMTYKYLKNSWIQSLWFESSESNNDKWIIENPLSKYDYDNNKIMKFLAYSGLIFGLSAIPGIYLFFKKFKSAIIVPTFFFLIFYLIGSEPRRMLILQPFIFTFAILFILYIYYKIRYRWTKKEIIEHISLP